MEEETSAHGKSPPQILGNGEGWYLARINFLESEARTRAGTIAYQEETIGNLRDGKANLERIENELRIELARVKEEKFQQLKNQAATITRLESDLREVKREYFGDLSAEQRFENQMQSILALQAGRDELTEGLEAVTEELANLNEVVDWDAAGWRAAEWDVVGQTGRTYGGYHFNDDLQKLAFDAGYYRYHEARDAELRRLQNNLFKVDATYTTWFETSVDYEREGEGSSFSRAKQGWGDRSLYETFNRYRRDYGPGKFHGHIKSAREYTRSQGAREEHIW